MASYSSDQIAVLQGLEPVRKRPGMYVGGTDLHGLHHLLWEVVGNVIDLHLSQHASELHVSVGPDAWVTVRDDGPGIPTEPTRNGESAFDVIFSQLCGSGTRYGHFPHVHLAPSVRGLGLAVVNALSERLEVETTYNGVRWAQAFERGIRVSALRRVGPATLEGTTIRFRPDPQIFGQVLLDPATVGTRLQELAWLNPHLRVVWQEQRLRGRGGVLGWARREASDRGSIECSHGLELTADHIKVDIGLAWNASGDCVTHSFVNMQPTIDGGTHVQALWTAFRDYARARKSPARTLADAREAMQPGLVAVVHVGLYDPRFGNPTKDQLKSPEAGAAVTSVLLSSLRDNQFSYHVRELLDRRFHVPAQTTICRGSNQIRLVRMIR